MFIHSDFTVRIKMCGRCSVRSKRVGNRQINPFLIPFLSRDRHNSQPLSKTHFMCEAWCISSDCLPLVSKRHTMPVRPGYSCRRLMTSIRWTSWARARAGPRAHPLGKTGCATASTCGRSRSEIQHSKQSTVAIAMLTCMSLFPSMG